MKANSDKSNLIMSCAESTTAMIDGLPIDLQSDAGNFHVSVIINFVEITF